MKERKYKLNLNVTNIQDVEFGEHPLGGKAVHAVVLFPNGYGASIAGGDDGLYGDGVNTFELAVIKLKDLDNPESWALVYDTGITDDVLGWRNRTEVSHILLQVSTLPTAT